MSHYCALIVPFSRPCYRRVIAAYHVLTHMPPKHAPRPGIACNIAKKILMSHTLKRLYTCNKLLYKRCGKATDKSELRMA